MRKILKGAIVLLIAAVMILTTFAASADTVKYKNESPDITIAENSDPYHKITPVPNPSGRAILWDNGLPDAVNGVSVCLWASYPLDREVIDDFIVEGEGWYVKDAHLRIVTNSGAGPEALLGFKVIFYKNIGTGCEPDTNVYDARVATFNGQLTGDEYFGRPEIAVDLEFDTVFLEPGRWWVCFQPELEDNCFWLTTATKECPIYLSYPDMGYYKWTVGNLVFGDDYDVSFQLTGAEKSKSLDFPFFQILKERSLLFRFLLQLF